VSLTVFHSSKETKTRRVMMYLSAQTAKGAHTMALNLPSGSSRSTLQWDIGRTLLRASPTVELKNYYYKRQIASLHTLF